MVKDLTPEEEEKIISSREFGDYLRRQRERGNPDVSIDTFLEIGNNRQKWSNTSQANPTSQTKVYAHPAEGLAEDFGMLCAEYPYGKTDAEKEKMVLDYVNKRQQMLDALPADQKKEQTARLDALIEEHIQKGTVPAGGDAVGIPLELIDSYKKIYADKIKPAPNPNPTPNPVILDGQVLRGWSSDEWQQLIDGKDTEFLNALNFAEGVEIEALRAIGKLPDINGLEPEKKAEALKKAVDGLSPVEFAKFNGAMNTAAEKLLETYPPKFMVFLHKRLEADLALEDKKKDKDANAIATLQAQKDALWQAMVNKLDGYNKGTIVIDQSNIADVYEGASEMFAYIKERDSKLLAEQATKAQKKLDDEIAIYDTENGFDKLDEKKAKDIEKAFDKASKLAEEATFEDMPEVKAMLDGLEFEDDDKSSAAEKKKTFMDIIRNEAARNAAVKGFADKDEDLKKRLAEELQMAAVVQTGALISTNELLKAEASGEPSALDSKVLAANTSKTIADLQAGKKVKISNKAAIAHIANAVNDHMGYLSRLSTKIGANAPVLKKIYGKISHLDKTSIQRFGPAYEMARTFGSALKRNMGSQLLNQGMRFGLTTAAMMAGYPGLGSIAYGTFYCGQAVWRLSTKYKQQKKQNGGKLNGFKFLAQNLPEVAMTALTTTAIICGGSWAGKAVEVMGNALPLDKVVSYSAMAIGYGTSLIKGFRASRKEGNGFWKSLGKSVTNASLSSASGFLAAYGVGAGINTVTSNIHFDSPFGEHATRNIRADEYNANDAEHYTKTHVASAEDTAKFGEMNADALNQAGVVTDAIHPNEAQHLVSLSDQQLAEQGIIRHETTADDPNGVKVIDVPAHEKLVYPENFVEKAQGIMEMWTKDAPGLLDSNISEMNKVLDSFKDTYPNQEMNAYRMMMIAGDCGAQMVGTHVDTNMNHIDLQEKFGNLHENTLSHMKATGQDMEAVHGNHKVFGAGWCEQHGISQEEIKAVAAITDANGKLIPENITPQVMKTLALLDSQHVSAHNEVGHTNGAPIHTDGVLHRNAELNEKGEWVHTDNNGKVYTTYADGTGMNKVNVPEQSHQERLDQLSQVGMKDDVVMTTTFDKFWGKIKSVALLGRVGSNGKSAQQENDKRPIRDVVGAKDAATQTDKKTSASGKKTSATATADKKDGAFVVSEGGSNTTTKKTGFFGRMFNRSK